MKHWKSINKIITIIIILISIIMKNLTIHKDHYFQEKVEYQEQGKPLI